MDEYSVIVLLILIIISLSFSAFFSGMEIAFISANRLKIALDNKQGGISAKILTYFDNRPSWFIGAMLLGNNAAIVLYSMYMSLLMEDKLFALTGNEFATLFLQTIITTIIVLFFAEFLPKAVFRVNPNGSLRIFSIPLIIIYVILWLPTFITIGLAEGILGIFIKKEENDGHRVAFEKIDLETYLEENTRNTSDDEEVDTEVKIFHNALNFSEVVARDCMIPRNEIKALEMNDDVEEFRNLFINTGHSKILVYRDSIDNIIGYVHALELFKKPEFIKTIMLPVSIVPESMTANKVLEELIKKNRSIALVVDEFGGTAGMVTMEDIIEEIFGEIVDEHDLGDLSYQQINENEFEFAGRAEIDLINENYDLDLPESDEYETLAGFIINITEDIPEEGEILNFSNFKITIKKVSDTRIEWVNIKRFEE